MIKSQELSQFMDKIKAAEKGHRLDLSSGEDLSMAVMNLIALEEHMFFNGNKTGKTKYFDLLDHVREMRKELMKQLVKDPEAEVWCTSKHLLAASMRLFEVGTKAQTKGDTKTAHDLFKKSYDLYNLFWGINLGMVKPGKLKSISPDSQENKPITYKKSDFMGKISSVIGKVLDCCRE